MASAYGALSSILLSLDAILDHNRNQLLSLRDKVRLLMQRLQNQGSTIGNSQQEQDVVSKYLDMIHGVASPDADTLALLARDRANMVVGEETEAQVLSRILKDIDAMAHLVDEIEEPAQDMGGGDVKCAASSPREHQQTAVVGIKNDLEKIKSRLGYGSSKLQIVTITGMGGIGKTTLATTVYNDGYINENFHICSWATVSQEHQFRRVLLDLLDSANLLTKDIQGESDGRLLGDYLYRSLKGKKYLIVMDDVWDVEIWDAVKRYFPDDNNGSRVLLTTRLTKVADYCSNSSSSPPYQMNLLNEEESWKLFCGQVLGVKEDWPAGLEQIGDEIVQNCKGLPLAIAVIGGLVSKIPRTKDSWRRFANSLSSAAAKDGDELMGILSLSYNHLPHHLKPCFLYTGMFPEDYPIPVTKLLWLWAAEGFLQLDGSKSPEVLADEYLNDLVERNLLLVHSRNSQGKIKTCMVHDVLRELSMHQAHKEKFLFVAKRYVDVIKVGKEGCCRLSICSSLLEADPNVLLDERLCNTRAQSLVYVGTECTVKETLPYKMVRVLDMLAINFWPRFPLELANLGNLRYLAMCGDCSLGSRISRLQNLQTLIIRGRQTTLPVEIWMLPNLRHLIFTSLSLPFPPTGSSTFALQTLVKVVDFSFSDEILNNLKTLKKLSIMYNKTPESKGWSQYKLENLIHLDQLEKLTLRMHTLYLMKYSSYPSTLALPRSLKNLTLRDCRIPWANMALVGALPNLEVLRLKGFHACIGKEWEPVEGQFQKLKSLRLEGINQLQQWTADDALFPCLQCLVVDSCDQLKEIPTGVSQMLTLERMELINCAPNVVASAQTIREEQRDMYDSEFNLRIYNRDG